MKIPRYWAKGTATQIGPEGEPVSFACWHWSDDSPAAARQLAEDRARQIVFKLATGQTLERYGYATRPLREEVVGEVPGAGAGPAGVITRNSYGALVLNAAQAMFVDIDLPESKPAASLAGALGGLFGRGGKAAPPDPAAPALAVIQNWLAGRPDWGLRVYRTAAGLRALVTSHPCDPTGWDTESVLQGLGCDPLYVRLTRSQECFRARLTPKPWRCAVHNPPSRYPWDNTSAELLYRTWQREYEQTSGGYAVCRLVGEYGDTRVHPEIAPVLDAHDRAACGLADRPLA
jgi:hypothetical protein